MNTFTDGMILTIESVLDALDRMGILKKRADELRATQDHLEAADSLRDLYGRAAAFTVTAPDGKDLLARLVAGDDVPDKSLIDFAARTTAAHAKVGPAAQSLIDAARTERVRAARDAIRETFPTLLEDLRAVLAEAGAKPDNSLIRLLTNVLKDIDKIAGRDAFDYWCICNHRTEKWAILERAEAEKVELSNQTYVKEKVKEQEEAKRPVRVTTKPTRLLSRRQPSSSGYGGIGEITAADLEAHRASKAGGLESLRR